jgi:hypothetical protein
MVKIASAIALALIASAATVLAAPIKVGTATNTTAIDAAAASPTSALPKVAGSRRPKTGPSRLPVDASATGHKNLHHKSKQHKNSGVGSEPTTAEPKQKVAKPLGKASQATASPPPKTAHVVSRSLELASDDMLLNELYRRAIGSDVTDSTNQQVPATSVATHKTGSHKTGSRKTKSVTEPKPKVSGLHASSGVKSKSANSKTHSTKTPSAGTADATAAGRKTPPAAAVGGKKTSNTIASRSIESVDIEDLISELYRRSFATMD